MVSVIYSFLVCLFVWLQNTKFSSLGLIEVELNLIELSEPTQDLIGLNSNFIFTFVYPNCGSHRDSSVLYGNLRSSGQIPNLQDQSAKLLLFGQFCRILKYFLEGSDKIKKKNLPGLAKMQLHYRQIQEQAFQDQFLKFYKIFIQKLLIMPCLLENLNITCKAMQNKKCQEFSRNT